MQGGSEDDVKSFGRVVRESREARQWSQENLASQALSGSLNKGFISRIENGKIPNITVGTVRNIARALDLDPEQIPSSLRPPEAREEVKDTNTVVHAIQEQLDKLIAAKEDQSREFGIKEGMLIALARNYAEGSPDDFDAALAGLERALEVARDERERNQLPPNTDEAVTAVLARIDALNETGDLEAGQDALEAELAVLDAEDEQRRAVRARLYEKGVAQAYLTRSVESACRYEVAHFDLEAPDDPESRHEAFYSLFRRWYDFGRLEGLNFDLEVAIALANEAVKRSTTVERLALSRHALGTALFTVGEREQGIAKLEQATLVLELALQEMDRGQFPLQWAGIQNSLGGALVILGKRESLPDTSVALLERAMTALELALEEQDRRRFPHDWAMTQINLGSSLLLLGKKQSETARIERAISVFEQALQELPRRCYPSEWAMTHLNLGNALMTLGELESSSNVAVALLDRAVVAHESSLKERTRERGPLEWAVTQDNFGIALMLRGIRESDHEASFLWLEQAMTAFERALSEFRWRNLATFTEDAEHRLELARALRKAAWTRFENDSLTKIGAISPSAYTAAPIGNKVGRNQPCPCGSGKKFKKCCG